MSKAIPENKPSLKKQLEKLPFSPGVYFFKDEKEKILYIGKAGSLKDRVGSYFREKKFFERPIEWGLEKVAKVDFLVSDSVLEAYFLEQDLIKQHRPPYNVLGKDDKSFCYVIITKERFPRVLIARKTDLKEAPSLKKPKKKHFQYKNHSIKRLYGPYASRKLLDEALKILRKIFPFHSMAKNTEERCFDFQVGLCPGPYLGKISSIDYQKNIQGIEMILTGKKKNWLLRKEKEMKVLAQKKEFEKAVLLRNQIFALRKIKDISLLKEGDDFKPFASGKELGQITRRIEGYDVSSLSGGLFVGSMVVFSDSEGVFVPEKGQYRKFRIKNQKINNDLDAMEEVLFRRLKKADWPRPDLILLDGGAGHLNLAKKILKKAGLKIPLLAVAKGPTRKKLDLRWWGKVFELPEKTIIQIRDEAHRFAITYHRKIRKKGFLTRVKGASILK